MTREDFLKLVEISNLIDEEAILIGGNKILGTDLTDVGNCAKAVNDILGKGDVGGRIGDGVSVSTATFGEFTAQAMTYPAAIVRLIVMAVQQQSLDKFFKDNAKKEKRSSDTGLGSSGAGRTLAVSRY